MSKGWTGQEVACSSGDMWSVGVLLFQLASGRLPFLKFVDPSSPRSKRQLVKLRRALIDHAVAWRVSSLLVPFQAACMPAWFSRQHACLFFGTSCLAWCIGWCSAQGLLPPARLACMVACVPPGSEAALHRNSACLASSESQQVLQSNHVFDMAISQ